MADAEGGGESGQNVKSESQPINIVVRDQASNEIHFKIKTTTKFEKVFKAYCEKKSLDPGSVKFVFDGARVSAQQSPAMLDMEDGDAIDVMVEQVGGGRR